MRRSVGIAAAAAAFAAAVLVTRSWRIDFPYSIDFQTYWLAGSRVLHGEAAKLYEPGGAAEGLPAELAAGEFKNLPIVAVAFAPLGAYDYMTAKRVFWCLSLGALAATAWVVGRFLAPSALGPVAARVLGAFALLAVMSPTHIALRHGQTTPWVTFLVACSLALFHRPLRAGGALAGACLVKFPPFALLAVDLVRGRLKIVVACVVALAVAVGASLALFGVGAHRTYVRGVLEQSGSVIPGHNNQSLVALATRLSGPTLLNDWKPVRVAPRAAGTAHVLALALVIAFALSLRRGRDAALESLGALALGIVILPVAWDHYFLLLAPGLVAALGGLAKSRDLGLLAALVVAFVLIAVPTPSAWLARDATTGWLDGLLVSHYALGAIVVLGVAIAGLRRP